MNLGSFRYTSNVKGTPGSGRNSRVDQNSLVKNSAEVVDYPAEPVAERDLVDREAHQVDCVIFVHIFIYLTL